MKRLQKRWRAAARYELVEAAALYATFSALVAALYATTMGVLS